MKTYINIEIIKKFLATKGYIWTGKIRDCQIMKFRLATIKDFENEKIVRLVVTTYKKPTEFIQRVIVSERKFKIENPTLNKLDCFENFSQDWVNLRKIEEEITKQI